MTLDEYLVQFIEGYLLEDLSSMAQIRPGKRYGAANYPMVMTALSGIEVLGALTSRTKFSTNGSGRFGEFWRFVHEGRPGFQNLDSLVYEFVRHGLAHLFMTKPMVRVTKRNDPLHLCRDSDNVLCVDALTLADDLKAAYWDRLRPMITGAFRANMEERFKEMRAANWADHEAKKHLLAKAPQPPPGSAWESIGTQVNSTSVPPAYSINSTTGFDKPK